MSSERVEQSKSLKDPGVVGARVNTSCVGCPADTADRLGELELAVAGGLSFGRAAARAVDRDDGRPMLTDKVNDLPARQVSLEHQNPAIIDDRHVEPFSLSADINAGPHSHASQHAPFQYSPRSGRARRIWQARGWTRHGHHSTTEHNGGEAPAPQVGLGSELWCYKIADGPVGGIMWVIFDHLRPPGHIMPDHAGDRGAMFLVLAPHDHLHIKHVRAFPRKVAIDIYAKTADCSVVGLKDRRRRARALATAHLPADMDARSRLTFPQPSPA